MYGSLVYIKTIQYIYLQITLIPQKYNLQKEIENKTLCFKKDLYCMAILKSYYGLN